MSMPGATSISSMPRVVSLEHAALGDVEHRLALLGGIRAVERDLLDACARTCRLRPSRTMRSLPSSIATSSPPAVNVPRRRARRAFWLMLMKPPAPASSRPEAADIDVALSASTCGHAETRHVEPAAVVEIELLVLLDDRVGVDCGAEIEPALRHAADHARLGRQRHVLENALLVRDRRDAFGHADAEIDDAAHRQLERAAARDDLALVERQRLDTSRAAPLSSPENAGLYGVP